MCENLRFTGDLPPVELLATYPNWEYALDEECVEGQDETTIRPAEDQSQISDYVAFGAADISLADGRRCMGLIEIGMDGVDGLNVLLDGDWYRLVRWSNRFNQFQRWESYMQEWLPEAERCPTFDLADPRVFPMRFTSRVPYAKTGAVISITILPHGGEETQSG